MCCWAYRRCRWGTRGTRGGTRGFMTGSIPMGGSRIKEERPRKDTEGTRKGRIKPARPSETGKVSVSFPCLSVAGFITILPEACCHLPHGWQDGFVTQPVFRGEV